MELSEIALVVGGLGLLLFGMKMMSTGLEAAAGDSLQTILKRATSNRLLGVLAGILATICINSSTAVTIITVGFVNSRLINLTQAIGIIMGANVGTTFSAQIMAFRISTIVPFFIFIGVIMYLFFKQRTVKNVGYVILGFGILLFSIDLMGGPLKEFSKDPMFEAMLGAIENPLAALFAGFAFTAVIQSSSATMGILVAMTGAGVPIPFATSAFIILGTNIGTSMTTVLASIPASRESKRAALFHISYDIIGSTIFGSLIFVVGQISGSAGNPILNWFTTTWTAADRQVTMFHTLYNIATLCVLFPFVKWLALLMEKIVPVKQGEVIKTYERKLLYLDEKIMRTPTVAVMSAHNEICRMGEIANENMALALKSFFERNTDKAKIVLENEKTVNYLHQKISSKLVEINHMRLSKQDSERVGRMFGLLTDMERIGDHAVITSSG